MRIRPALTTSASIAALAATFVAFHPTVSAPGQTATPDPDQERWSRVELIAGSSSNGDGGKAFSAQLVGVGGIAVDAGGNVFVSDSGSNRVRRIDAESGVIETVAGSGLLIEHGDSRLARDLPLQAPGPLALDPSGRFLYVGEVVGARVLRIDLASGLLEDMGAPAGGFGKPSGLLPTAKALWVTDSLRSQLWLLTPDGTWQGVLPEGSKLHGGLRSLAEDAEGRIYFAEYFSHRILRLDPESGSLDVVAGTGEAGRGESGRPAVETALRTPDGLLFDAQGHLLVADMGNKRICRIDTETGLLTTLWESGPLGSEERWTPSGLALGPAGELWVGDIHRNRVLRFGAGRHQPTVVAGASDVGDDGPATAARLAHPSAVAADREGNIYISDTMHHRVRVVDADTGIITTLAGTGIPGYNGDGFAADRAWLSYPAQIQVDDSGQVFIGDYYNNRVRVVDPRNGRIFTLAGTGDAGEEGDGGPAKAAHLTNPHVLYLDGSRSLIVASAVSSALRRIDLKTGTIARIDLDGVPENRIIHGVARWKDGLLLVMPRPKPGTIDLLREGKRKTLFDRSQVTFPYSVAVSPGGELYVCDTGSNRILRWTPDGMEVVLENLGRPRAISFDARGNLLIADTFHNRVLRVRLAPPAGSRLASL